MVELTVLKIELRFHLQIEVSQGYDIKAEDFIEGTSRDDVLLHVESIDQPELSDDDIQELLNQIYG
jgi:hypothetical protein